MLLTVTLKLGFTVVRFITSQLFEQNLYSFNCQYANQKGLSRDIDKPKLFMNAKTSRSSLREENDRRFESVHTVVVSSGKSWLRVSSTAAPSRLTVSARVQWSERTQQFRERPLRALLSLLTRLSVQYSVVSAALYRPRHSLTHLLTHCAIPCATRIRDSLSSSLIFRTEIAPTGEFTFLS